MKKPEIFRTVKRSYSMTVAKVTEIIVSSPTSFDDAIKQGIARSQKTVRNLKSAWVQNQQVKLDGKGNITEYRVQLKISFLLDD
jgi:dodecin